MYFVEYHVLYIRLLWLILHDIEKWREKNTLILFRGSKNMQFGAVADIYKVKN